MMGRYHQYLEKLFILSVKKPIQKPIHVDLKNPLIDILDCFEDNTQGSI